MIPTDQTTFRSEDGSVRGNCLSAAIASLLHLPIEDVPLFVKPDWRRDLNAWLRPYGIAFLALNDTDPAVLRVVHGVEGLNHVLSGASPRHPSIRHACIGVDGKLVFDPHPDRSGFDERFKEEVYPGVFVLLEPWKYVEQVTRNKTAGESDG